MNLDIKQEYFSNHFNRRIYALQSKKTGLKMYLASSDALKTAEQMASSLNLDFQPISVDCDRAEIIQCGDRWFYEKGLMGFPIEIYQTPSTEVLIRLCV